MRWLEKSYARVLQLFKAELAEKSGLKRDEIEICIGLATQDLAGNNLFKNLSTS